MKIVLMLVCGCLAMAGCGNEAPTFEPGSITVTSDPAGAAILLDGEDTGLVTPATLADLDAGLYVVSVRLAEWAADPAGIPLELRPAENVTAEFTLSRTGIRVLGPAGARIIVDGTDTGRVAPAFVGLEPGTHQLSLELDGYHVLPASRGVTVTAGEIVEVPGDEFALRSRRTVIVEGFANVSCLPCPQLTANLVAMTAKPEFSPDRVTFLEFSVSWPELADPFYLANPAENSERFTLYQVLGAPDLYVDGVKQADALDAAAMEAAVRAALEGDPGFLVDVAADFSGPTVPVAVTLRALAPVDLTGTVLYVALYEKIVRIDPAPGLNGQTEFHHVFRDRAGDVAALGIIDPGTPTTIAASVNRGDLDPANLVVVAFVQRPGDRVILQGGSTAVEGIPE
jgi:hypothetical protein